MLGTGSIAHNTAPALLAPVRMPSIIESGFSGFAAIARHCGVTKQAVSKSILALKDSCGYRPTTGKTERARDKYRKAQLKLVREHRHASHTFKTRQQAQFTE